MFRFAKWKQMFWIIGLVLITEGYGLLTEPYGTEASVLLVGKVFGVITYQDTRQFLLVTENIGFLILFHILYGNYISEELKNNSIYIFSRIWNRKKWFFIRVLELTIISTIYSSLFIGLLSLISLKESGYLPDENLLPTAVKLFFLIDLLLLLSALVMNLMAIKCSNTAAFFLTYGGISGLIIIAVKTDYSSIWSILNPLSCIGFMEAGKGVWRILIYDIFLIGIVELLGAFGIDRMDIGLQDRETS